MVSPVTVAGGTVGALHISRDLEDLRDRVQVGAAAVVAFLLIALAASFLIAHRIQHVIAAPLLEFVGTAHDLDRAGLFHSRDAGVER